MGVGPDSWDTSMLILRPDTYLMLGFKVLLNG